MNSRRRSWKQDLAPYAVVTVRSSAHALRLKLWDEERGSLVPLAT